MKRNRVTQRYIKELKKNKNGEVICLNCWTIVKGKMTKVGDGVRSMKNVNKNDIDFMNKF